MRRQTVGPFHSSQFSPLVFIPLWLQIDFLCISLSLSVTAGLPLTALRQSFHALLPAAAAAGGQYG